MIPSSRYQPYATYLRYLADHDSEALFALEETVESLAAHPGWRELVDIMAKGKEKIDEMLTDGETLSQADYARVLGFKAGLEQMPKAIEAVLKAAEALRKAREAEARKPEEPVDLMPDGITVAT